MSSLTLPKATFLPSTSLFFTLKWAIDSSTLPEAFAVLLAIDLHCLSQVFTFSQALRSYSLLLSQADIGIPHHSFLKLNPSLKCIIKRPIQVTLQGKHEKNDYNHMTEYDYRFHGSHVEPK